MIFSSKKGVIIYEKINKKSFDRQKGKKLNNTKHAYVDSGRCRFSMG